MEIIELNGKQTVIFEQVWEQFAFAQLMFVGVLFDKLGVKGK